MKIFLALLLPLMLQFHGPAPMETAGSANTHSSVAMINFRFHVYFSGNVQGVGFRQSVRTYAMELGLVGWVKNLEDQRVEMVAEGSESDINLLIGRMCNEFEVKKAEVKKERPEGTFKGFEIVK
ncbi:MAG: acylphosphatase [Bacteroidia bacterium]